MINEKCSKKWQSKLFHSVQVIKAMDLHILQLLFMASFYWGFTYMYCHIGQINTDNFLRYAQVPYEALWYRHPIDLQKCLRLIMAEAQRPCVFQGIGLIDLNLETFGKVFI